VRGCASAWLEFLSSVVVLIVDEDGIISIEGKGEPPVSIDADCPIAV
jgi:hypothetical protein